jgi:hypothetical protein
MKITILAVLTILSIGTGAFTAQAATYQTPAHNFYQNNWISGS